MDKATLLSTIAESATLSEVRAAVDAIAAWNLEASKAQREFMLRKGLDPSTDAGWRAFFAMKWTEKSELPGKVYRDVELVKALVKLADSNKAIEIAIRAAVNSRDEWLDDEFPSPAMILGKLDAIELKAALLKRFR